MELQTTRLVLRRPAETDIDDIYVACQDPEVQRFTLVPVPYTRTDAETFVREMAPRPESSTWVIRRRDDQGFVGVVGLRCHAAEDATIGYWCAAGARGQGYLTEAVRAVVADGFDRLGLQRIAWSALVDNVASARLAATCGFRYTGETMEEPRPGRPGELVHTAVREHTDIGEPQSWPSDVVSTS